MTRVRSLLRWLRLEDEHGVLSLTTVAFIVGCVCVLLGRQVPLDALATFALALGVYHGKKHLAQKRAEQSMTITAEQQAQKARQEHELSLHAGAGRLEEMGKRLDEVVKTVRRIRGEEQDQKLGALAGGRG